MRGAALFTSTLPGRRRLRPGAVCTSGWNLPLAAPVAVHEAWRLEDVRPLVAEAEAAALQGWYVALALAYEAAPAFDPAMRVLPAAEARPLAWMALHAAPAAFAPAGGAAVPGPWLPLTSRQRYSQAMTAIRGHIERGESYQINYTMAFEAEVAHAATGGRALFIELAAAQGAGFCAWMDMGHGEVVSLSPELFFARRNGAIVTRPMKGTAPRGRYPAEDQTRRQALAACPKNRAENVMIVDLLRSDVGRVALPGSVRAARLFRVEPCNTVLQMTSTVGARLRPEVGLCEIFAALFPCGSVTGAPKISSMECIARLEDAPRGFYCGALGFLAPGGDAVFNVPIRTLHLDPQRSSARFHVGGGVTYDSLEEAEYRECQDKMAFLQRPRRTFRLLETLLLAQGRYMLLEGHLQRLQGSASYFGYRFEEQQVRRRLQELALARPRERLAVRLLLSCKGELEVEARALLPDSRPWDVAIAAEPVDSGDMMLFHKTDSREPYERRQKANPDCHEVLLVNEKGQLTEGARSTIVLSLQGERLTPALDCGLLPGVLRQWLLHKGVLREALLYPDDLRQAEAAWCVNSLRGWRRVGSIR